MGRPINDALKNSGHSVVPIVNGHRPDVDKDVETQVDHFVQWEEEWVDVVWDTLHETIHWVKGMTCKWRRKLPNMVGLVQVFIEEPVMKKPMDPVDTHVCEEEEGDHTEHHSKPTVRGILNVIVQFAVATDFCKEQSNRWNTYPWK